MRISPVKRNSLSERARERQRAEYPACKRKTSTDCTKKTSLPHIAGQLALGLILAGHEGAGESGHVKTFTPTNLSTRLAEEERQHVTEQRLCEMDNRPTMYGVDREAGRPLGRGRRHLRRTH